MIPMFPVGFAAGGSSLLNGLIAWWNLDEASGGPYLDSGPNGITLAATGTPTQVAGLLGNATNFTRATPDFVSASSNLLRPANYSVFSGWMWFNQSGGVGAGTNEFLANIYSTGGGDREWFTALRDTGAGGFGRLDIVDPVGTDQDNATAVDLDDATWGALYFSYDVVAGTSYIRVKKVGGYDEFNNLAGIVAPNVTAGDFAIGCNYNGLAGLGFNGDIFGVGFWNRALTSDEQGFDNMSGGLWNGAAAVKYPFTP